MTDLTGAELALAVAQVVRPAGLIPTAANRMGPRLQIGSKRRRWRPDQGGAAAWEVLEWVRGQVNVVAVTIESCGNGGSVCMVAPAMSFHGTTIGHGSTDAIALCRAVVALGEAR